MMIPDAKHEPVWVGSFYFNGGGEFIAYEKKT